jgi:hypothetical protein
MPRPNPLTPEVQVAFLRALRGGALIVAAAAHVGVAVQTLYRRRGRDAAFDAGWTAAAEASLWVWRGWEGVPTGRRLRFAGERRAAYLKALRRKGDRNRAARSAGVDPRTVRRGLRGNARFARADEAALALGRARRARWAAKARARAAERMRAVVERVAAAMADPGNGQDRYSCPLRRRWRPRPPGGWRGAGLVRAPTEAIPILKRKLGRIELAGWKRARSERGPPLWANGAFATGA